jgi:tetratricopeptide (TPR) repeat protein
MKLLFACPLFLAIAAAPLLARQENPAAKAAPWPQDKVNAALVQARKDTAEKQFQDSETLMLQVTQANPQLVLPWVELGMAQMGLKKYPDAEDSFKMALGMKTNAQNGGNDAFYASADAKSPEAGAETASRSAVGGQVSNGDKRTPEILGPTYASLGEVYAHENKVPQAKAAFDEAVKALPAQAAQYRGNETIVFFETSHPNAQLAAAKEAIPLNPGRAQLYYFEGQALVAKSTIDPKTQKLILPPGCADAYQKYLKMEPNGQFSADVRGVLTAAGVPPGK